jgi:hypothetical protein
VGFKKLFKAFWPAIIPISLPNLHLFMLPDACSLLLLAFCNSFSKTLPKQKGLWKKLTLYKRGFFLFHFLALAYV